MKPVVIGVIVAGLLFLVVGWFTEMPYRLVYGGAGLATLLFGPFCLIAGHALGRDSR